MAPWLTGLIVDGVVGGVGAVLGFVPQMLVLFFDAFGFEDGLYGPHRLYHGRIFRRFGLSARALSPCRSAPAAACRA